MIPDNGQFKRWPMSQGHIPYLNTSTKLLSQKMLICNVYYFGMNNVCSFENMSNVKFKMLVCMVSSCHKENSCKKLLALTVQKLFAWLNFSKKSNSKVKVTGGKCCYPQKDLATENIYANRTTEAQNYIMTDKTKTICLLIIDLGVVHRNENYCMCNT